MGELSLIHLKPSEKKDKMLSKKKRNFNHSTKSLAERIMHLQRTAGNQAVQHLIRSGNLQAKLRIGQPGDRYEQEADRVADAVMGMKDPQTVSSGELDIQRVCPSCEENELKRQPVKEEEEEELRAKTTSGLRSEVNQNLEYQIQSLRGGGKPLSENERAFFEPRFGHDFSQLRLHTDTRAAEMARTVKAHAFTMGRDIVFGAGQYLPDTKSGRSLIAHELTHAIQQRASNTISPQSNVMNRMIRKDRSINNLYAGGDILQTSPETCTYGEIRPWAITSMRDFTAPGGLGDAKASIGAVCTPANCHCRDGSTATAPADQAAWRNIVAASGTDLSGGGNYMCVGSQNCWFVNKCYSCVDGRRTRTNRASPLTSSGTSTVSGRGTLYFYNDPLQGWCNAADRRSGCRRRR